MTDTATYALKSLHRSLDRVRSDKRLPFHILASTRSYVDSLLPLCQDPETGLFDLLFLARDDRIDDTIIAAAVPTHLFGPLQRLRTKHDALQLDKESAIRVGGICDAQEILARQRSIDLLISKLVPQHIKLSPAHVVTALRLLGYTGSLPSDVRNVG